MTIKSIALIAVLAAPTMGCLTEPAQEHDSIDNSSDDVTEMIQNANVTPDQRMLAVATTSKAYIAFADEFQAKGYIAKPEYAVDLGTSEAGQIYLLPFETGSNTLVVATAFQFDGDALIDVSAAEFELDDVESGVVFRYDNGSVYSESLDPSFRSFATWWDCFWPKVTSDCAAAALAGCYGRPSDQVVACISATCGGTAVLAALYCLQYY